MAGAIRITHVTISLRLKIIILFGIALGFGAWLQLRSANPWIGEPQTCLQVGSGLCLLALLASLRRSRK